jgi:hypothetical protein
LIRLATPEVSLALDPGHGAEVLELIERRSGAQLLGRPPFRPAAPRGGDLDEETWIASYRGGWQIVAPNAGNPCVVGGHRHGFHGRASVDPWEVLECNATSARLGWRGHGIELSRQIALSGSTVHVDLRWTALKEAAPMVVVEHICLGRALLSPEVEIDLEARAFELSEPSGPPRTPDEAPGWPEVLLLDGTIESAGRWPIDRRRARFISLTDFARPSIRVTNPARDLGVTLTWDASRLPGAWVWHESRASGGIWSNAAELLAIEPASVPHSLGLAEAVRHEQALWAAPDTSDGYSLQVTVETAKP